MNRPSSRAKIATVSIIELPTAIVWARTALTRDSLDSQVDQLRTFLGIHFTSPSAKGGKHSKGLKLTSELKALKNFFDFPLKSLPERSRTHKKWKQNEGNGHKNDYPQSAEMQFLLRQRLAGKKN